MKLALAAFFKLKWAQQSYLPAPQIEPIKEEPSTSPLPSDTSLGVPIDAKMAWRLKNKMMLAYDRTVQELTTLPFFKEIYKEMNNEHLLEVFEKMIRSYTGKIATLSLKDAFEFGVKYVAAFNQLRDMLPKMIKDRKQRNKLEHAIWSTQKYMWRSIKRLLNIHDIGAGAVAMTPKEADEMQRILGTIPRGSWDFGPMADPTRPYRMEKDPVMEHMNNEWKRIMKGE